MNEKELNYLLTNFACDRLDTLAEWLREKDCDKRFIHDVIDASLKQSIKNVTDRSNKYKKLLMELKNK